MNVEQIKQNKLKMILQFSIPSIIAMLLETVITMTDGFFTGNFVGENALAAINLGLPILYLYLGIGLCVGVGGTVISGRLLGAGDNKKAGEVFSQTMVTSLVACVIISVAVLALFGPIQGLLKADGALSGYFKDYYMVMLFDYPLMVLFTVFGMFVRIDGKPQLCMGVGIIGCLLNAVLDYVFVALLGMGVFGSAIGSLIVEVVKVTIMAVYFLRGAQRIKYTRFSFDGNVNKETLLNGSSEFIGEMSSAISMFAFNYVLMKYAGAEGVAAFTLLGYVVYGYSMVCVGFGQGLAPLVSFLIGANERMTAVEIRKTINKILFVLGTIIAAVFIIFGRFYAGFFGCGENVVEMAATGFMFYALTFVFMGYDVINSMYFTSCGDAKSSALISALRGIVLLLTFTLVLPMIFGINGIWMAGPATEIITSIVSLGLIIRQRNLFQNGEQEWKLDTKLLIKQ
ncbi:MAG: MATE family efflux transporter [Lachnospiraceae bacterium]|nr:MATE family efflux transporter [Lachnospiraceae bacterium]